METDWSSASWSYEATGDTGPWARYIPLAWQMAADPDGRHEPPLQPRLEASHGDQIAWWSPLMQMLMFGLGWAYPTRGLARWDQMGRPTDEPILATVERWWGVALADVLAWGADYAPGAAGGPDLTLGRQTRPERGVLFQPYGARTLDDDWIKVCSNPG